MTVSRSGDTWRPCSSRSSPVFTMTVRRASSPSSANPSAMRAPPNPPAITTTLVTSADDLGQDLAAEGLGPLLLVAADVVQVDAIEAHVRELLDLAAVRLEIG